MVTAEFITALALAKTCGSKPRLIFNFTSANNATATNTITEALHINLFATLSFLFN